jgi:hypothetical protein
MSQTPPPPTSTPSPFNLVAELAKLKANPPSYPFIAFLATRNKGTTSEYQEIYIKHLDASDGTFDHMQRLELDNGWPIVLVGNLQTAHKGDGVTTSSIGDEHVKILKHFENAETIRRQTRTQVEAERQDDIDVLEAKLAKAKAAEAARADAAAKAKADVEAAEKAKAKADAEKGEKK